MTYLPFSLLAYFLNGVALLIDKFLLTKSIPNPLLYIFYISLVSLLALLLLPFTHPPSSLVFWLSQASTLLWTSGAYFMFKALRAGLVARVIPVIGTLTPLFLLLYALKSSTITQNEVWAVGLSLAGLILITSNSWLGKIKKDEIVLELSSAVFFAISYLILKQAYLKADFLTVMVTSRWILIPLGLGMLLIPKVRSQIIPKGPKINLLSQASLLFALGQTLGGTSQLLLTFSISLASPALVNSLQGVQYVFLILASLLLAKKFPAVFKKEASSVFIVVKMAGIVLLGLGLYILAFSSSGTSANLGVTYSPRYARELGLDEKATFIKILDDLKVKKIRLPVYWDAVETFPQTFNFGPIDFYLNEALKRQVEVILVLGYKLPRWPECFAPEWVKKLMREEREKRILELLGAEVEHFKSYPNILAWQIENEPFLSYGVCDPLTQRTEKLLSHEVEIVKGRDQRPVVITDSGELGWWFKAVGYSDFFGTTLYRQIWSPYLGIQDYPLPPIFYTLKNQLIRAITGKSGLTIISELQSEPWIKEGQPTQKADINQQVKILPLSKLKGNISYASQTGFSQIYLWGVEWWYFMAKNGHPEYLEYAKSLF